MPVSTVSVIDKYVIYFFLGIINELYWVHGFINIIVNKTFPLIKCYLIVTGVIVINVKTGLNNLLSKDILHKQNDKLLYTLLYKCYKNSPSGYIIIQQHILSNRPFHSK